MIVGDTNNDIVYSTDDISMLSLLDNIFMIWYWYQYYHYFATSYIYGIIL